MDTSTIDASYIEADVPSPTVSDAGSLPESATTSSTGDYQDLSDADREWRESLQQLELLLTMVLMPTIGKYFGRKFAYWGWTKYMTWKYPVDIVVTDPAAFKGTGAIQAAASL